MEQPDLPKRIGPYTVIKYIGRGAYSEVYLVKNDQERFFAIKILKGLVGEQEDQRRYHEEAKIARRLHHPGIVRIYENGVDKTRPYIVMEYAPGGSLWSELQKKRAKGALLIEDILSSVKQIADALQYAHDQDVIHGDVKPENILLDRNGHLLLADFGTAQEKHSSRKHSTQTSLGGTQAYMAPEQKLDNIVDKPSDQFALGVMVYEWLCGERPFKNNEKHYRFPSFKSKGYTHIPRKVEKVVRKALTKNYKKRYQAVYAFAQAFERAVRSSDSEYAPQPIPLSRRVVLWIGKNGMMVREILMSFLIGLALQGGVLIVGVTGMALPLIIPNLSVMPGFAIASLALALLCVNAARDSYKHGFVRMIVTTILSGAAVSVLFIVYKEFLTRITEFVVGQPSRLVSLIMVALWLAAVAILPPLLTIVGFISSLVAQALRHKG